MYASDFTRNFLYDLNLEVELLNIYIQAEGIFRINAENSQEEIVREQLNSGVVPDGIDVHCLAGLIKVLINIFPSKSFSLSLFKLLKDLLEFGSWIVGFLSYYLFERSMNLYVLMLMVFHFSPWGSMVDVLKRPTEALTR